MKKIEVKDKYGWITLIKIYANGSIVFNQYVEDNKSDSFRYVFLKTEEAKEMVKLYESALTKSSHLK